MSYEVIDPGKAAQILTNEQDVVLVDVRSPVEYRELHAEGAELVPLPTLNPESEAARLAEKGRNGVVVICQRGSRSKEAAEKLDKAGLGKLHVVEGGTLAWAEAGLPVVRGKKARFSVERQTQMVIGTLVLTFTLLGAFVHEAFLIGAGFVGAGLFNAGLTGICPMGSLIARMPWNMKSS